jgi:FAD/FMN-containing dehydrogenase
MAAAGITALKEHIASTSIKVSTPHDAGYDELGRCFISRPIATAAIVRPQTAEHVSTLIRFCTSNGLEICVRGGGHDCDGRTKGPGTVVIDLRDINYVCVSADKSTARVGGGALLGKVARDLDAEGLVTPT